MSKRTISITVDDKTEKAIKEIGEHILFTDNVSAIIRYCVKVAEKESK